MYCYTFWNDGWSLITDHWSVERRLACGGTAVNRGPLRLLLEKQSSIWKTMDTLAKTAHWEFFKESHNIWKEARSQRLTFSQGNLGTPHIHDIQTVPFPHTRFSLLKDKPLLFFSWMRWPQHFKTECDGTQNFFRYRDRYFFPGPNFSGTGTGTFFRDQIFPVPVPVPSKKEQNSRDREFPGPGCHTLNRGTCGI